VEGVERRRRRPAGSALQHAALPGLPRVAPGAATRAGRSSSRPATLLPGPALRATSAAGGTWPTPWTSRGSPARYQPPVGGTRCSSKREPPQPSTGQRSAGHGPSAPHALDAWNSTPTCRSPALARTHRQVQAAPVRRDFSSIGPPGDSSILSHPLRRPRKAVRFIADFGRGELPPVPGREAAQLLLPVLRNDSGGPRPTRRSIGSRRERVCPSSRSA
jgi:hypothetical protein